MSDDNLDMLVELRAAILNFYNSLPGNPGGYTPVDVTIPEPVKQQRLSKFRAVKDVHKLKIGDIVSTNNRFPMRVVAIFENSDCGGDVYLDFDGNEGDVFEENVSDIQFEGSLFSVLWKKLTR